MARLRPRPEGQTYRPARFHHVLGGLCDDFVESCEQQRGQWVLTNAPPRHGKTELSGRCMPATAMLRTPGFSVLYATSTSERAEEVSLAVRRTVEMLHTEYGVEHLAPGPKWTATEWVTEGGNGWVGVGVGKATGGIGANMAILDDTTGNAENARSGAFQRRQRRWIEEDILSRLMSGGGLWCMETRRGLADGHAYLAGTYPDRVHEVVFPWRADAESVESNPLEWRNVGEYLWDEDEHDIRFGAKWHALHPEVRGMLLAQLYQQRPVPAEGGVMKRAWLKHTYELPPEQKALECSELVITADCAGMEEIVGDDATVFQCWGRIGEFAILLDQVKGRWGIAEQVQRFVAFCAKWPKATQRRIENAANGMLMLRRLRKQGIAVQAVDGKLARKNKLERAAALLEAAESGRILVPRREYVGAWIDEWRDELCAFDASRKAGAVHDDQWDASAYAVAHLAERRTRGLPKHLRQVYL